MSQRLLIKLHAQNINKTQRKQQFPVRITWNNSNYIILVKLSLTTLSIDKPAICMLFITNWQQNNRDVFVWGTPAKSNVCDLGESKLSQVCYTLDLILYLYGFTYVYLTPQEQYLIVIRICSCCWFVKYSQLTTNLVNNNCYS